MSTINTLTSASRMTATLPTGYEVRPIGRTENSGQRYIVLNHTRDLGNNVGRRCDIPRELDPDGGRMWIVTADVTSPSDPYRTYVLTHARTGERVCLPYRRLGNLY